MSLLQAIGDETLDLCHGWVLIVKRIIPLIEGVCLLQEQSDQEVSDDSGLVLRRDCL
jgi:hypothetical protein